MWVDSISRFHVFFFGCVASLLESRSCSSPWSLVSPWSEWTRRWVIFLRGYTPLIAFLPPNHKKCYPGSCWRNIWCCILEWKGHCIWLTYVWPLSSPTECHPPPWNPTLIMPMMNRQWWLISNPLNNWVVVSNICYFHPYLGKWSNLTIIFQMGWNHQLDKACYFQGNFAALHP